MLLPDGSTLSDAATAFNTSGYAIIRGFIDPVTVTTVSKVIQYGLTQDTYNIRPDGEPVDAHLKPSKYERYAEPIVEVILENSADEISQLVGERLLPTYSYARVYVKGDELARHTDRPSCEYSVTVHVATVGDPWPIWLQKEGGPVSKVILHPGDAIVYKGCEVYHWRNAMTECDVNVQFMMHYVNENGKYADYKWDKRPGLGHLSSTRR